jgi:hypothetical protein
MAIGFLESFSKLPQISASVNLLYLLSSFAHCVLGSFAQEKSYLLYMRSDQDKLYIKIIEFKVI